jgi:hypothetical protein
MKRFSLMRHNLVGIVVWLSVCALVFPRTAFAHDMGGVFIAVITAALAIHGAVSLVLAAVAGWALRVKLSFLAVFWRTLLCTFVGAPVPLVAVLSLTNVSHDWAFIVIYVVSLLAFAVVGPLWARWQRLRQLRLRN